MRIHYLRDVVAGCAGALLVLAVIGVPRVASSGTQIRVDPSSVSQCVSLPGWRTGTNSTTPKVYEPICYKEIPRVPQAPRVTVPQVKVARPVPAQTP